MDTRVSMEMERMSSDKDMITRCSSLDYKTHVEVTQLLSSVRVSECPDTNDLVDLRRSSMAPEGNIFDHELSMACVCYTLAASSEYWLVSWLYNIYNIKLPIFFAIVQNGSWPLQGLVYLREKKSYEKLIGERVVTPKMYQSYIILGTLNAVITLTRTLGLVSLPPTVLLHSLTP
jgi:hypothetical protein